MLSNPNLSQGIISEGKTRDKGIPGCDLAQAEKKAISRLLQGPFLKKPVQIVFWKSFPVYFLSSSLLTARPIFSILKGFLMYSPAPSS